MYFINHVFLSIVAAQICVYVIDVTMKRPILRFSVSFLAVITATATLVVSMARKLYTACMAVFKFQNAYLNY